MWFDKKIILGFLFLVMNCISYGQLDWGSWSSVQINYKAGSQLTFKLKPIWRQKNNFSEYNNSSIDLILAYKIDNNWSLEVNNRHWFIPNGGDREFWFFDINHKIPLSSKIILANKLRYHLGVDWNREEVDFLRWLVKITYKTGKKIDPFIGNDFFYRFPKDNVLDRMRYKFGAIATISKKIKLTIEYWRQFNLTDQFNGPESNFVVINLSYNLN